MRLRHLTVLPLALVLALPAQARELTETERASLDQAAAAFVEASDARDFDRIVDLMPDRVLDEMASDAYLALPLLEDELARSMREAPGAQSLEDVSWDPEGVEIRRTGDGEPYALVPFLTDFRLADRGPVRVRSLDLALLEDGEWRFVRVSQGPFAEILREAYPRFDGVNFPPAEARPLE